MYIIGGKVIGYLYGVIIMFFFEVEYFFEFVVESEVQGLGREVMDDVGSVFMLQGYGIFVLYGVFEVVINVGVVVVKMIRFDYFILLIVSIFERIFMIFFCCELDWVD